MLSIWLRQFLRCFGMYWIIPARSSMIQRLSPCSYLSSGSTPFTERCLTQLPGIDLASLWSYDERLVICRTEESRPGGKGLKPGKPKKKGLLSSFGDWFGSINMMNILYVWFPASWGPSVVEAIQKRNVTCLAKKPIVRDPHIFDRKEAAKGSRAREVTCRIQKWNIQADGFHPILVANARVDWLALKDDDITKKFPILLEGILQDVFSQRASSAWQGAQPQKLSVNAPPRDQFCFRMARLITIQTPILAHINHSACLSCPCECRSPST